jgi:hypothetical protein
VRWNETGDRTDPFQVQKKMKVNKMAKLNESKIKKMAKKVADDTSEYGKFGLRNNLATILWLDGALSHATSSQSEIGRRHPLKNEGWENRVGYYETETSVEEAYESIVHALRHVDNALLSHYGLLV